MNNSTPQDTQDQRQAEVFNGGFFVIMGSIFFLGMSDVTIFGRSPWLLVGLLPTYWIVVTKLSLLSSRRLCLPARCRNAGLWPDALPLHCCHVYWHQHGKYLASGIDCYGSHEHRIQWSPLGYSQGANSDDKRY